MPTYNVRVKKPGSKITRVVKVKAATRSAARAAVSKKYGVSTATGGKANVSVAD